MVIAWLLVFIIVACFAAIIGVIWIVTHDIEIPGTDPHDHHGGR